MNKLAVIGIIVLLVLGAGGFILYKNMYSAGVKSPSYGTQTANMTPTPSIQGNSTIVVTSSGFQPRNLAIKAGTSVIWINNSGTDISVNSNDHPTHLLYSPLNLGRVSSGGQVFLTFNTPGTYGYHNHLNPSQTGTIIVQ